VILTVFGAFLVFAVLAVLSGYIQKGLWMKELRYTGIFWTLLSVKWGLFWVAFVVALLYLWINLHLAAKNRAGLRGVILPGGPAAAAKIAIRIPPLLLKLGTGAVAAVAALFFGLIFYGQWDTYLRFLYSGSFGLSDPLFGADAGFYVFRIPFYELLQSQPERIGADRAAGRLGLLCILWINRGQPQQYDAGLERQGRSTSIHPVLLRQLAGVGGR
jgi:hypothetical protein